MSLNSSLRYIALVVLILLSSSFSGCSNGPSGADFNTTNARRLRTAYNIYARLNNMKGPKSEEEFKGFFQSDMTGKVRLTRIGVEPEDFESIFVSERDGKPFKIRYGLNGSADHAVVFEEVGVDGLRHIALWDLVEVGDEEYEKYWSGKIKPAAEDPDAEE